MKRIVVAGGSGFVGEGVIAAALAAEAQVAVLDLAASRFSGVASVKADLAQGVPDDPLLRAPEAVVNLAGAPIFRRWTDAAKKEILESRVLSTRNLVASFADPRNRPRVLLQASGVGYYGETGGARADESSPRGLGFLADVCEAWEAEARAAEAFGVRVVIVRQAVVLGPGGYLAGLAPFAKWGFAGRLGSGEQVLPWIHRDDLSALYVALLADPTATGVVNAAAPEQLPQRDFAAALRPALRAPWELPVPEFALRLRFGEEMVRELVLSSQRVETTRLPAGFSFAHPKLAAALEDACAVWQS